MLRKITAVICVFVLTLSMGTIAFAGTTNTTGIENRVTTSVQDSAIPSELDEILKALKPYISTSDDGDVSFDERAAIADGLGEELMNIGRKINEFSHAMKADPAGAISNAKNGFEVWGNWCGPLHSGPEAPIGTLDSLCQTARLLLCGQRILCLFV